MNSTRYLHVSWDEVEQGCLSLYAHMCQDDYKPDIILGVMKGGVYPAGLFVDFFGIPMKFVTLSAKSYTGIEKNTTVELFPPNPDEYFRNTFGIKEGSKILIVDDIWDTGRTMNAILKTLRPNFLLKVATLFARLHKKDPREEGDVKDWPDYWHLPVNREWIVFPWERYEFWREIHKKP